MASYKGKLIKKNDERTNKIVTMTEYPWLNLDENSFLFADNAMQSVVLSRFHDQEELKAKVKDMPQIYKTFAQPQEPIYPQDLTEDFKQTQLEIKIRKKRKTMDEIEAVAYEISTLAAERLNDPVLEKWRKISIEGYKEESYQTLEETSEELSDKSSSLQNSHENSSVFSSSFESDAHSSSLSEQEIQREDLNLPRDFSPSQEEKAHDSNSGLQKQEREHPEHLHDETRSAFSEKQSTSLPAYEKETDDLEDLSPKDAGLNDETKTKSDVSAEVAESKMAEQLSTFIEKTDKAFHDEKEKFIKEGQHVFLEIVKLCSEKILREQLVIHEEALNKLFEQMISSSLKEDNVSIEINPAIAQQAKTFLEKNARESKIIVKENAQLEIGDFRIENSSKVTNFDLKKNVETIFETMKKDLFSTKK